MSAEPILRLEALDLARRAASGDTAATAELLRLLAPEMRRVVVGVMGSQSPDVDDALQQSLIGLIHALPAFRGECAPAGYACRIAFRTALAVRTSSRRHTVNRRDADEAHELVSKDRPDTDLFGQRRTEIVRTLLEELPREQAEALAMRTMMGWSLEEIASSCEAPVNTVRSRLRLAKDALRKKIESDPALLELLGNPS